MAEDNPHVTVHFIVALVFILVSVYCDIAQAKPSQVWPELSNFSPQIFLINKQALKEWSPL